MINLNCMHDRNLFTKQAGNNQINYLIE